MFWTSHIVGTCWATSHHRTNRPRGIIAGHGVLCEGTLQRIWVSTVNDSQSSLKFWLPCRWAVFQVVGANPTMKCASSPFARKSASDKFPKAMYQWYQIEICLLKFDFFFFGGVTMQVCIIPTFYPNRILVTLYSRRCSSLSFPRILPSSAWPSQQYRLY